MLARTSSMSHSRTWTGQWTVGKIIDLEQSIVFLGGCLCVCVCVQIFVCRSNRRCRHNDDGMIYSRYGDSFFFRNAVAGPLARMIIIVQLAYINIHLHVFIMLGCVTPGERLLGNRCESCCRDIIFVWAKAVNGDSKTGEQFVAHFYWRAAGERWSSILGPLALA